MQDVADTPLAAATAAAAAVDPALATARAEGHRAAAMALAGERRQLGDALRQARRAQAAAELADARAVEVALSAAPEHLRTLGLAFRVYLVGVAGPSSGGSVEGVGEMASALSSNYRAVFDPLAVAVSGRGPKP